MNLTDEQQKFKKELYTTKQLDKKIRIYEALKSSLVNHPLNDDDRKEYDNLIRQQIEKKHEISEMINKLEDNEERNILMLYYVGCYTIEQITRMVYLNQRTTYKKFKSGIINMYNNSVNGTDIK